MKKTNFLYASAIMMAFAFGMTSCEQSIDNPVDSVNRGATLSDLINDYAQDGVLELPSGLDVELTETLVLDAPLTITSKGAPATIIAKAGFVTSNNIILENVNIDASNLGENLISLPSQGPSEINNIASITLADVKVTGLSKALFYSAAKNNLIENLTINNSIIEVAKDITVIDFTKGSAARNINIENSTMYATSTTSKSMYSSQSGQKLTELDSQGIQTFKFANSTFYNFAKTKNFFSHRQANQKWLAYNVSKCIFVDCGKSGQAIKGLNGGQSGANPIWTINGNVFNFVGEDGVAKDTSENESTGDDAEPVSESIAVVVAFADAANGDFSQSDAQAGDPRWIK